ncbi:2-oxoglutarate dehydrogenase, E1 component [Gloeophyllum trabeum ATCC 11539]|uniref:2-oxoglutarate dehydrogenase, E1 component n=1 Tax=Gloeophyllum trabeum (strain ATCC 11539 / FP-39264 / Madison 617) TaxID=670483 RepID=S7PSX2_GLOTA|nr:2-oxoglutarate dehydrogenase, E1 component [Gloeophyllum trabeum ATCC 11539]EPQ50911.1 2-oxoglutarate dehydrogenase, E1 component [Gloeophyllum trabeum ATCC 11539]
MKASVCSIGARRSVVVARSNSSYSHVLTRRFHQEGSFGYRKAREVTVPDYTPAQLQNRTDNAPLLRYVDSMRTHGHRAARIDPLDLMQRDDVAALDPTRYGLTDSDKEYNVNGIIWTAPVGTQSDAAQMWKLRDIVQYLRSVYVGRIAYEYMHSPSKTERLWFSNLLESEDPARQTPADLRKRMHELLARSETFDQFLQVKFPNLKRYGLEGGESMLPALDELFRVSSQAGIQHIILAMPHRGRLNLLTDLLQYSPTALFHKIKGGSEFPETFDVSGDVISHLVSSPELRYDDALNPVKVSLLPNPSHLEAVNPVALGKTRAKQYALLKTSPEDCMLGDRVMCVQLHGDASFTGQGVVMETLGLSNLPHFTSGGSVHIVVNNNIGYTTPASEARSSLYCSDIGKMIHAPVLHVNGDYPEDVARAVDTAFKYRNYFRKDVIIDLIVYRRWGHNELDEPAFTQPLMYRQIRARKSVPQLYEDRLVDEGLISREEATSLRTSYKAQLDEKLSQVAEFTPEVSLSQGRWKDTVWPAGESALWDPETGLDAHSLKAIGRASVTVPEGFQIHPRLQRHVKHRLQSLEAGTGLDWATAEAMAFGSLMQEGCDVRISGQDVGRGTFSQRHAMLVDQESEKVVIPLNGELGAQGKLELANSSLSEFAVLGFEYGVSWETPGLLPIWEAQFGDFFNGAQIIIDTFIASAETKWLKQSGIVLLLPHGLDGAGPEHSSSRLERWLQLTNDRYDDADGERANVNMGVVFPTTPAQYFHLLRRQMKRNFRKPLIVAAPKGLLRLPAAMSPLSELEPGTKFQPVLDDQVVTKTNVERVVFLSGKLYYDLVRQRQDLAKDRVALVRLEELSPFPFAELRGVLSAYPGAKDFVWVQEEPRNQGAYGHVAPRVEHVLRSMGYTGRLGYRGRKEDSVPAPGVGKTYRVQQEAVLKSAFA